MDAYRFPKAYGNKFHWKIIMVLSWQNVSIMNPRKVADIYCSVLKNMGYESFLLISRSLYFAFICCCCSLPLWFDLLLPVLNLHGAILSCSVAKQFNSVRPISLDRRSLVAGQSLETGHTWKATGRAAGWVVGGGPEEKQKGKKDKGGNQD